MKKIGFIGVVLLLSMGMSAFAAGAREERVERFRFATGGVAGVYFPFGTAIATTLNERLGIEIIVQATGASRANIMLIADEEAEMALVQNDVMDYAWRGVNLFAGEQFQGFRAVATLYHEVCQIVAVPGINSIANLRGRQVSVGDAGSGTEFNARQILAAHGISFTDIHVHNLGFGASADALRDGRIDAAFVTSGAPTPAVVDLALGRPIAVLPMDPAATQRLMSSYPFYSPYTIRGGTYSGMPNDITTVAVKATLIVCESLPEEIVYRMTRALFEHRAQIALGHARGNDLNATTAVEGVTVPFHPGAARYYRSIGAMR